MRVRGSVCVCVGMAGVHVIEVANHSPPGWLQDMTSNSGGAGSYPGGGGARADAVWAVYVGDREFARSDWPHVLCVHMKVCAFVSTYAGMHVCLHIYLHICLHVCLYICVL